MGWNQGYTIFEATVIGAYDLHKLDKNLLTVLMEPYRGTDIDSGGKVGLRSKDGKEVEEIVIEVCGLEVPKRPQNDEDDDALEEYYEMLGDTFHQVTHAFGWQ